MAEGRVGRTLSYDAIVVAGRVAGSLTAILLARAGQHVLVVERARMPSPTLSTHFFRGDHLVRVLSLAGVLDDVLALGPLLLTCEYYYMDGEAQPTLAPAQDPGAAGYCLSVRRESLDATLLECCRRAGVDVRTSTTATRLVTEQGGAVGVELSDGSEASARLVIGADGRRSMVADAVEAVDRERYDGKRALYYRYVSDLPGPGGEAPDGAEFSLIGDELAYVFPSDEGLTCVAISVNLAEYERLRHDARHRFDELLRRHAGLWERYADSTRQGRLFGSGPQDDFVRQAAGPGWALVGDSGIHQDPWSGAGMDSAAVSAALLVDSVTSSGGLSRSATWATSYERARDDALVDWFRDTVLGAADLSSAFG